jgi:hypothetical protein
LLHLQRQRGRIDAVDADMVERAVAVTHVEDVRLLAGHVDHLSTIAIAVGHQYLRAHQRHGERSAQRGLRGECLEERHELRRWAARCGHSLVDGHGLLGALHPHVGTGQGRAVIAGHS